MAKNFTMFSFGFFAAAMLFLLVLYFTIFSSTITGLSIRQNPSAPNRINESNILVYPDRIIIYLSNATISNYVDSESMKPTLDSGANGIRVQPDGPSSLAVGDIITFKRGLELIVHRIIDIGIDEKGIYYVTKGDNNPVADDGKVRFEDIEYVTVGVLW